MGCEQSDGHCHFEFWAGESESFFCDLKNCSFQQGTMEYLNRILSGQKHNNDRVSNDAMWLFSW
jgi:hypothetical protein